MFEVIQHTADVRLRIRGDSIEELFREAVRGLTASLQPLPMESAEVHRTVTVESVDRTTLLVDFLNEVLWLADVHGETFHDVKFAELTETRLAADLRGTRTDSFGSDIKAVTYHEAEVTRNEQGVWETMLVLDI
jgi:SHS2 domain-containing protein